MTNTYNNPYKVCLYYGYEETTYGVYHAFITGDPEHIEDAEDALREMLEPSEENTFDCDFMDIGLPDSVVNRIKQDAIKEYLADVK